MCTCIIKKSSLTKHSNCVYQCTRTFYITPQDQVLCLILVSYKGFEAFSCSMEKEHLIKASSNLIIASMIAISMKSDLFLIFSCFRETFVVASLSVFRQIFRLFNLDCRSAISGEWTMSRKWRKKVWEYGPAVFIPGFIRIVVELWLEHSDIAYNCVEFREAKFNTIVGNI